MYTNIGLRNHQAVVRNGQLIVENWKNPQLGDFRDDALKAAAVKYAELLDQQQTLFRAMNILVNT